MNKILMTFVPFLLLISLMLSITSCKDNGSNNGDYTNDSIDNNTSSDKNTSNTENNTSVANSLSVANERLKVSSNPDSPQLKYTYSSEETNVYVFYIGQVYNVPVSYGPAYFYDGTSDMEITYTNAYLTEESVTATKSSCISNTVSYQSEKTLITEAEGEISAEFNVLDMVNISRTFNIKNTVEDKKTVGNGQTYSYSDIYETSKTHSTSSTESIKYVLGEKNDPNYYYRLTLFAQCDVYAFVVYNSEDNTVAVSFDLSTNANSLYYAIDKSTDSDFPASNAYQDKLKFDTSILKSSDLFDYQWKYAVKYELNGGTMDAPATDIYTPNGITFPTPSREYYTFGGWYLDSGFNTKAKESDIVKVPDDITLYAKWDTVTWTRTINDDFEVRNGRNYFGTEGFVWSLDKDYLEQYQKDGYQMQITMHYEVLRYDGDYSTGVAYIAVAKQDSNGAVDPSAGGLEYALASESFEVAETHTIYEGTITATTSPETLYVKKLGMIFVCNNDDVLGGVLTTADDYYTVTNESYITITFVKAD